MSSTKSKAFIGVVLLLLDVFVMLFSIISAIIILWNIGEKAKRMGLVVPVSVPVSEELDLIEAHAGAKDEDEGTERNAAASNAVLSKEIVEWKITDDDAKNTK